MQAVEDALDFGQAEHHRQFLLARRADQRQRRPVAAQGVLVEGLDTRQGNGAGARRDPLDLGQVQEILAQFFFADLVGRLVIVGSELAHRAQVEPALSEVEGLLASWGRSPAGASRRACVDVRGSWRYLLSLRMDLVTGNIAAFALPLEAIRLIDVREI